MNSLDLITVKKTVKEYIDTCGLPKEASRLILKEVLEEVTREALNDAMKELSEKESGKCGLTEEETSMTNSTHTKE